MTSQDKAFGCVANTIRLRSGLYFDLADPKPEQFTLEDIAGALSKICRFGGQINEFYSVAEHSYHCYCIAVARELPLETQRATLMHDAAEAFIGDIVKPLKIMLRDYDEIESLIENVIFNKFGIDMRKASMAVVKLIDREMLIAERKALFTKDNVVWTGENQVANVNVKFNLWSNDVAEKVFLNCTRLVGLS